MATLRQRCWSIQARAGALSAALALAAPLAFAQLDEAALQRRLFDLGEQSRFVPEKALAGLLQLQPELANASPSPSGPSY